MRSKVVQWMGVLAATVGLVIGGLLTASPAQAATSWDYIVHMSVFCGQAQKLNVHVEKRYLGSGVYTWSSFIYTYDGYSDRLDLQVAPAGGAYVKKYSWGGTNTDNVKVYDFNQSFNMSLPGGNVHPDIRFAVWWGNSACVSPPGWFELYHSE